MIKKLFLALIAFTLILLSYTVWSIKQIGSAYIKLDAPTLFEVKNGQGVQAVCKQWAKLGWFSDCGRLKLYIKLFADNVELRKGMYELQTMQIMDALKLIAVGKQKQFSFTIIEGESFKQVSDKLRQSDFIQFDLADTHDIANFEGWLLPETYFYVAHTKASELVSRAKVEMERILNAQWDARNSDLPLASPYEALILASIIEKETAIASERQRVASVFVNRLNKGMRLQTDPTVIYGLGEDFKGDITRAHLQQMTPYNTYRINGLPPTPIAMPSKASVIAAFHPETSDYFYFVADGNGGHTFSKTLSEHNRAVKKYLEKSKNAR